MKKLVFVLAIALMGTLFSVGQDGCAPGNFPWGNACCVQVGDGSAISCTDNNVWCCFGNCNPADVCEDTRLAHALYF